jgi:hypothetical protein
VSPNPMGAGVDDFRLGEPHSPSRIIRKARTSRLSFGSVDDSMADVAIIMVLFVCFPNLAGRKVPIYYTLIGIYYTLVVC